MSDPLQNLVSHSSNALPPLDPFAILGIEMEAESQDASKSMPADNVDVTEELRNVATRIFLPKMIDPETEQRLVEDITDYIVKDLNCNSPEQIARAVFILEQDGVKRWPTASPISRVWQQTRDSRARKAEYELMHGPEL